MIQIVPVLDILGGQVVRAVGGRRSEYAPLVSRLCASTEPLTVAQAIHSRYGFTDFYLADLDAIGGAAPAIAIYDHLRSADLRLWVDAGLRQWSDADLLTDHTDIIIAGLETFSQPFSREAASSEPSAGRLRTSLRGIRVAAKRLAFSLDLRDGRPLGHSTADPLTIVERVVVAGIRRIIVLDLARVGMGQGTQTERLCAQLIHRFAGLELFVGGGIRGLDDLRRLESLGVTGALVASALHDGKL